jgi:hypothetical protein
MKTIQSRMSVILTLVLCGTVWAARGGTNEVLSPVRLEITLVDGSYVIGVPIIQALPLQTAYAKIQVPLMKILAIDIRDDHETATFTLENGDTLTGVISLEPITLATVFGTVAITSEHVKGIRVVPSGGALPESVKKRRVLYYTFDREDGEKVTDRSGKENDGRMSNTKVMPTGKIGQAYELDGQSAVVNAGHGPSLDITRDLTISLWVYPRKKTFGDPLQVLIGKDDGSDETGRSYLIYLVGGAWCFGYGKGAGNGWHNMPAAGELDFEKWHHIVAVHKTGVGNSLYADGKLVSKDTEGSSLPSNPNMDVILGDSQAWESWYLYGALDEVMIFDAALSESDVMRIHGARD